jgi:hypothetical protein
LYFGPAAAVAIGLLTLVVGSTCFTFELVLRSHDQIKAASKGRNSNSFTLFEYDVGF